MNSFQGDLQPHKHGRVTQQAAYAECSDWCLELWAKVALLKVWYRKVLCYDTETTSLLRDQICSWQMHSCKHSKCSIHCFGKISYSILTLSILSLCHTGDPSLITTCWFSRKLGSNNNLSVSEQISSLISILPLRLLGIIFICFMLIVRAYIVHTLFMFSVLHFFESADHFSLFNCVRIWICSCLFDGQTF